METKICMQCGLEKGIEKFHPSFRGTSRKHRCTACSGKKERCTLRWNFFQALGKECACCGESDSRFLTLDHVDNSGAAHRKIFKPHQIYRQAMKEGYPVKKYQVLCFNCNMGRDKNGGICPHHDEMDEPEAWAELENWTLGWGRKYVNTEGIKATQFKAGYDGRRMQEHRRVLKPCIYCGERFGSNEMVRHKREKHKEEFAKKRQECLALGRNK